MKKYILAPSVLSANFMDLKNEIDKCLDNGVEWIHYDVMDYHFVPNLTFGSKILQDIKNNSNIKVDIHFMVEIKADMEEFFSEYIKAKPEMMTMHIESLKDKSRVIEFLNICKSNNIKSSIAISPDTNVEVLNEYLELVDNILVMSVYPGFGGQKYIPHCGDKIKDLYNIRNEGNYKFTIEVDGGINAKTVKFVKDAGVDMIVAGSYFFGSKNIKETVEILTNDK